MADAEQVLKNVTLAVLAGGAGSRMGGPKGELIVRGVPILQYLLERLAWPGPTLLVTAPGREHPPASALFDREVTDAVGDEGPFRGVLTAIEHAGTSIIAIVTVDMPGVTTPQMSWLVQQLPRDSMGVMMKRRIGSDEQVEPFPLVLRASARSLLSELLQRGERSVWRLRQCAGFSVIDAPTDWPEHTWMNLNAPADYNAFVEDEH
ncbi:MAG TPA: molybdenum cofactor guanylyltransferase [Tepidisphaeraceae bacterium]|nr:molybdenum cofactor guanylyltransferase [Tepidisphaeraceae bacterium]